MTHWERFEGESISFNPLKIGSVFLISGYLKRIHTFVSEFQSPKNRVCISDGLESGAEIVAIQQFQSPKNRVCISDAAVSTREGPGGMKFQSPKNRVCISDT